MELASCRIYTDHNVDQTAEIVDTWAEAVLSEYHNVNLTSDDGEAFFPDEEGSQKWTAQRYWHVIRLREEAIQVARTLWADFIFFLDGDAMLSNPKTIQDLVEENRTIIAPMLDSRSAYSNFWCGMNEKGYYERTDDYMPILEREKVGVFPVVMVHSATLINLNHAHSRKLTYDPQKLEGYTGPNDDVITFAHSAKFAAVEMFISNKDQYGHILAPTESPANEAEELLNLKLDVTVDGEPLLISPALQPFVVPPRKDTLGFDQVYLINLERRPERRKRMEYCFEELGIAFKFIAAVDGKCDPLATGVFPVSLGCPRFFRRKSDSGSSCACQTAGRTVHETTALGNDHHRLRRLYRLRQNLLYQNSKLVSESIT
ncbi:hypothetical protein MRX96_040529 [Rhipicephalus microplus]